MNKLHGEVKRLYLQDKARYNIRDIHYGKNALDMWMNVRYGLMMDSNERKAYVQRWNSRKLNNSVYYVHPSKKSKVTKVHRFISCASFDSDDCSYLGHLETTSQKQKSRSNKRKTVRKTSKAEKKSKKSKKSKKRNKRWKTAINDR
ncbi:MAG: hypothetical protein CMB73_02660 [Euryarchaeota archaeon]|nr:hypothetical protein [Euryarchaeota archaeon]